MSFPRNIPDFRTELDALVPDEAHAEAVYAAQAIRPVPMAAASYLQAMATVTPLPNDALKVLLGAAYLILTNGWVASLHQLAFTVAQRAGELEPEPPPEPGPEM